tara:strand:+ start:2556 stop:2918 length:363 start_codon:yes stop_codon:yes gene_type:complete
MKASIKITSVGGGPLTAGNVGTQTAGDYNFPIDCLGATDVNYNGDSTMNILVNNSSGPGDSAPVDNYSYYKFNVSGSTDRYLLNKSFVDAILSNNGSGESIVTLPEGVTITSWEIDALIY